MVSLLQDTQENDQRLTMLQLVDKMKIKHKELGWFYGFNFHSLLCLIRVGRMIYMWSKTP